MLHFANVYYGQNCSQMLPFLVSSFGPSHIRGWFAMPVALHESVKFSFSVAVWLLEIEIIIGRSKKDFNRG